MGNLDIYNACREVPKEAQKPFSNGKFSGTDINPMWRIKKLTEQFGAAGVGWYVDDVVERCEVHGDVTIAIVTLNLYVKVNGEWSKPIYGTGGNVLLRKGNTSDEGYKMAYTDALSVACKALGIGADIWFANDKTKYTLNSDAPPAPKADEPKKSEPPMHKCDLCGSVIKGVKSPNGMIGAMQWTNFTTRHYGQNLCVSCLSKNYPDWEPKYGAELK